MGFNMLESTDYVEAVLNLQPDITLGLGDVVVGQKPSLKRMEKMSDRTLDWLKELISGIRDNNEGRPRSAVFAPILPIEPEQQRYYLADLRDDLGEHISGLVIFETRSILAIPTNLNHLPRLSVREPGSPSEILEDIALGVDMFTIPFVGAATDAGIALDFSFPAVKLDECEGVLPLGIDMWSAIHSVDLSPLRQDCQCYTCVNHHRAYLQHLLNAKEMLGWVLLQLHNHHIMDQFFAGVRNSLQKGSFDHYKRLFAGIYDVELPAKTGQGPRYP